jgi:cysteinyl-tRNA synthetase
MLEVLERWDRIFAVLEDTDHAKLMELELIKPLEVAASDTMSGGWNDAAAADVGKDQATSPLTGALSEEEIDRRLAERNAARARRDFAASDKIRDELLNAGVILEDTKAGTRWKRK